MYERGPWRTWPEETQMRSAGPRASTRSWTGPRRSTARRRKRGDAADALAEASGRRLLAAVEEGDMLRTYLAALKRFTKRETLDTVGLRRQVAAAAIDTGGYPLA